MPVRHPARACRATRSSRKGTNSQANLTRRPRTARLHEARRCIRKLEIENAFLKKCRSLLCWSVHGPLSPQSRRSPSGFVRHVFCSSLLTRKRLSGHDCSLLEKPPGFARACPRGRMRPSFFHRERAGRTGESRPVSLSACYEPLASNAQYIMGCQALLAAL